MREMQAVRVERYFIDKTDSRWKALDEACFLAKNLYNAATFLWRQSFIFENSHLSYNYLANIMKSDPDYCALPRKVSQWVLRQVEGAWQAFQAASAEYRRHPEKFAGRPNLPNYKHKTRGRTILTYTEQAISKKRLKAGYIAPSGLEVEFQIGNLVANIRKLEDLDEETEVNLLQRIQQVRIVPKATHYVVEVIYRVIPKPFELNPEWIAGIDIGLDNLAAITSNKIGFQPILVNGRPLKSINQFFNKRHAILQAQLPVQRLTSHRIQRMMDRRNRRIEHYLHAASRQTIEYLVSERIGALVIGKNDGWKQGINIGKRNNQNFVSIPHARFVEMLTYKAQQAGIKVMVTEESYTSKCSFLDMEPIQKHTTYRGRRIKRGLFCASNGRVINADINGAANIIRKVVPEAFTNGIEAVVVSPLRVMPV
jgi:putative transposase